MMTCKLLTFTVGLFVTGVSWAQDTLSLERALTMSLERNYAIRIAQNEAEIAAVNNTRANAGQLPLVNFNIGDNASAVNFKQRLANGTEITRPLGLFNTLSANLAANWTLYDGRRMYIEKQRLEELQALGTEQVKAAMLQTMQAVATGWYELAQLGETRRNLNEVVATLQTRLDIANNRLNFGVGNKADVLQAQIDLNDRQRQIALTDNQMSAAQTRLNNLIGQAVTTRFVVLPPSGEPAALPEFDALRQQVLNNHPDLAVLERLQRIAQAVTAEAESQHKPRVGLTGGYNFALSNNTTGFSLFSRQHGPVAGITFSIPVYTGGNIDRQVQAARLAEATTALRLEQRQQLLDVELLNLLAYDLTLRQNLQLDQKQVELARQNEALATERFRQAQTNALEPRQAQLSLENALSQVNRTRYELWLTALLVQQLGGEIN
jgi:outer membrane protein